jgi:hypothetical protein
MPSRASLSLPTPFRVISLAWTSSLKLLVILCVIAVSLAAQTGQVSGTIRGLVSDASGSPVANAEVRASGLDTGFERRTVSNEKGEYEVPLLPLGTYKIEVSAPGLAPYTQSGIGVRLDAASLVNVTLQVGSTQQAVTVQSDASILNTGSFDVGGSLNARSMENMPITSRNTFNLALFSPGLNGTRDDEFGNPTFAFGGMQRKAFMVDGIDNTQRGGPGRLGIFSPEDIQEVKVIANAMDAEYGRTVGGIVSMITKSGTNDTHGEFLLLERRPGLIARPSLAPPPKPFQQWATYSLNVGGPVKKDKLFYFVSAEYEPEDGARPITITPANAAALGIPASDLGSAPFKQRFQSYLGRIDYQLNSTNDFYFRYSEFMTPSQYNTSGGLMPQSASNNFDDRNDTAATQWTSLLSPRAVNELRFGFLRREFTRPPVSGVIGPIVSISGVATLGSNSSAGQYYEEDQFNFIDHFSYTAGAHQMKFGADIDTIHVDSSDRLLLQYSFSSLTQYLGTVNHLINPATRLPYTYAQITQQFGNNNAEHRTTPLNLFAEDHYQVRPNLSLSYGIRWEYRFYPTLNLLAPLPISRTVPTDASNFAPRFGFVWQPSQKTVVRGGYGILYDTPNLRLLSLVDRSNGSQVLTYTVNGTNPLAPVYPNTFAAPTGLTPVKSSVYGFAPNFKTQYAHQANLQVERELAHDIALTVGVQWYGGHREPLLLDANLGAPTSFLADGRPVFSTTRPNPQFNQIFQIQSVGNSVYYGGYVGVSKRFSHNVQFTASYTLGWAFNENDSVGDNGSNVTDSTNIRRDWAFSSSDQRHRFVFQGVWQPRFENHGWTSALVDHWTLAPNATVTSGFPFTAVAGSDLNNDGVNNDYPLFGARNRFRGPGFHELNLRLSRVFPLYRERVSLEVIGEAENLLNSTNAACSAAGCGGAVVTQYNAANFSQITSAFNSRQIQLGGRLRF